MNEKDRHREEQLTRLFASAGPESIPTLEPDPGLPTRIRALAAAGSERSRTAFRLGWAWVSVASVVVMLAAGFGGYLGYRAASAKLASEQITEADAFMTALYQSGFVEDLNHLDTNDDEVNQ
jgi:hypothetical protein